MSLEDVEYYRARAAQEHQLAKESSNPEAAKAHAELARGYEILVERAELLPLARNVLPFQKPQAT